jgi:hypothetical protein
MYDVGTCILYTEDYTTKLLKQEIDVGTCILYTEDYTTKPLKQEIDVGTCVLYTEDYTSSLQYIIYMYLHLSLVLVV